MINILHEFKSGLTDLNRDEIFSTISDKNDICNQIIIDQVAENKRFELPEKPFGAETCPKCNGIGQKILFERVLSVRVCLKCESGKKTIDCTKCQNGRYISDKGTLKINVECKFCHGTKQREIKCRTCRSTGELRKMVITPEIKSTTPCKHCRELGFVDEKIFSIIDDTEKFNDIAETLLEAVDMPTEIIGMEDILLEGVLPAVVVDEVEAIDSASEEVSQPDD